MKNRNITVCGAALLVGMFMSSAVGAQTSPSTQPPLTQGPLIPGVCMMSVNQAISTSTVGQYVSTRMNQIVAQVKAELGPDDTAIATDGKALEAGRASMDQATFQAKAQALQARISALRDKADLRQAEVKATEQKAINRIAQELDPIARQLYQARKCSIMIDKGSVLIGNPEMDLTSAAISGLNARIQQFPFDREHITPGAAPAR